MSQAMAQIERTVTVKDVVRQAVCDSCGLTATVQDDQTTARGWVHLLVGRDGLTEIAKDLCGYPCLHRWAHAHWNARVHYPCGNQREG